MKLYYEMNTAEEARWRRACGWHDCAMTVMRDGVVTLLPGAPLTDRVPSTPYWAAFEVHDTRLSGMAVPGKPGWWFLPPDLLHDLTPEWSPAAGAVDAGPAEAGGVLLR